LTRVSFIFIKNRFQSGWIAGHRRAEATPSSGRLCPAMTILGQNRGRFFALFACLIVIGFLLNPM